MNANEVIAHLATKRLKKTVHPNDHVNYGQSSNDVIPTAIHVAAALLVHAELKPALKPPATTNEKRARPLKGGTKTGRTHPMDATPLRFAQQLSGWARPSTHAHEPAHTTAPRTEQRDT